MPRGEKKSTVSPFSPSRSTSSTGGVAEPTMTQPQASASISDHDNTNG